MDWSPREDEEKSERENLGTSALSAEGLTGSGSVVLWSSAVLMPPPPDRLPHLAGHQKRLASGV